MKNKAKNISIIVLVLVIVAASISAVVISQSKRKDAEIQLSSLLSEKDDTTKVSETVPTVVYSEVTDVESTTKQDATKKQVDFLLGNAWWYYFDIENRECYAFSFKKDGNLDIAYFNNKNIDVGDAKYFTGTSTYTVENDKIIIKYLPDALKIKSFELTIKDNKLFNVDDKLAPHDDLSLDYPVGYYMVLDQMK